MRLLVLSVTCPFPANNGVKMRTWSILRGLAAEGHELTVVAFADPVDTNGLQPELSRICRRVIQVPHQFKSVSQSKDYFGRAAHLFAPTPYGVAATKSPQMASQLTTLLSEQAFDALVCEQTDLLANLPPRLPLPLVVDFHNADYLIMERYARFERNPAKRLYALLESRKLRAWERRACQCAASAWACSEHDRKLLQELNPGLPMFVVPNVVDVDEYKADSSEDPRKILFQGGMDWYPNRDAVEFFVTQIFSRIQGQAPDVKFVVAGRNPPEEFRQRLSLVPGVEFTGTVPDMRAEIAGAAVCVVPLRMGSGTRLKILESAAMAKPIVSTRLGAEGLEFRDGEEIVLADQPAAFANVVLSLLSSATDRHRLGQAARKRAEQLYSLPALRVALRQALGTSEQKARTENPASSRATPVGS